MSRYRTIDIRMHGDAVVASLSRPLPNARSLWDHLLYGPSTGVIPGLYRAREAQLAEELGWDVEPFRQCFQELFTARSRLGFEGVLVRADWGAGLVWVPNGIKYNAPANPNVVKSWAEPFDELPECQLKIEAYRNFGAYFARRGKGFPAAFERLPKPFAGSPRNGMANQDQDQDQETGSGIRERPRAARAAPAAAAADDPHQQVAVLEQRYRPELVTEARTACALSRRNGKMADTVWLHTLQALAKAPVDVVERSFRIFAERHADGQKDERYLLGIVRGELKPAAHDPRRGVLRAAPASAFTPTNVEDLFGPSHGGAK